MPVSTDPKSSPEAATRASLLSEAQRALESFNRLKDEQDRSAADPDVIQEDRSSTRLLAEKARRALWSARNALARLDEGTYGVCEVCGTTIPPERLEAVPDTTTCRSCS